MKQVKCCHSFLKRNFVKIRMAAELTALTASMICHIGERWAGTWVQTRGVICNGFSTGEQFKYNTNPLKENDGPFSMTDEDWIPHSAGWLTGLIRLYF